MLLCISTISIILFLSPREEQVPRAHARALAKFTPVHHLKGGKLKLGQKCYFLGNACHAFFAWRLRKTTNGLSIFGFSKNVWPYWLGEVAKGSKSRQLKKNCFLLPAKIAISL